jgi:ABC-type multidrug transport system ATPase subunit
MQLYKKYSAPILKSFFSSLFSKGPASQDKVAVKNTCLELKEGRLLALLGQNGAGKSTTMSILAGLTPATGGDALIYGLSVREQMGKVRECVYVVVLLGDE